MQKIHLNNMHSWIDMCKNRCEQCQYCLKLACFFKPYAGLRHLKLLVECGRDDRFRRQMDSIHSVLMSNTVHQTSNHERSHDPHS